MFPAVVGAEEQLTRVREQDTDVRLSAAAIAQVQCVQRLGGGYSSGQCRLPLASCLRPLYPSGSGLLPLLLSTTHTPSSAFPNPGGVRHKRNRLRTERGRIRHTNTSITPTHGACVLPVLGGGTGSTQAPCALIRFYTPITAVDAFVAVRLGFPASAAWRAAGSRRGTLPFK